MKRGETVAAGLKQKLRLGGGAQKSSCAGCHQTSGPMSGGSLHSCFF